jgi:hypothetical protein
VELLLWIVVGVVAGVGFIALVPVLVVGGWFVVITVILGLADRTIWLLDQMGKLVRGPRRRSEMKPAPPLGLGDLAGSHHPVSQLSAPRTVTSKVPGMELVIRNLI